MKRSHIISNVVPVMGWICWYVFTSVSFYMIPVLIYIFVTNKRQFLSIICILVLCALLPKYLLPFSEQYPLYTMDTSLQTYIGHTIIGLRNIKKNESYIFAVSPHGSVPICSPLLFHTLQGKRRDLYYSIANILFKIPIMNIFFRLTGYDSVKKSIFKKKLQSGQSIYFQPGGFQDMFLCEQNILHKKETISIPFGWIKYALQYGKKVIPIYNFDENRLSSTTILPFATLRKKIYKLMNLHLFYPFSSPPTYLYNLICKNGITSAIGKPIIFPIIHDPSNRDIARWHRRYCKQLLYLVDKYKTRAGYPDLQLTIKELEETGGCKLRARSG